MFRLSSEFALPNWLVRSPFRPLTPFWEPFPSEGAFWLKFMAISFVSLSLLFGAAPCWLHFLEHFTHLPFTFAYLGLCWKFSHIAALTQLVADWPAPLHSPSFRPTPYQPIHPPLANFEFDFIVMISIVFAT